MINKVLPKILWYLIFGVVFISKLSSQQGYEVPDATIEILHPKGFTVSIPDEEGIKLFAFHGNINQEFEGREAGLFARDITSAANGRWTFTDRSTRFSVGDVIYYWLYVDYFDGNNKLGYLKENQRYVVTNIPKNNANKNKGNQGNKGNQNNKGNQGTQSNQNQPTPKPTQAPTLEPPACNYSPTKVKEQNTCSGNIIFSEEFNELNENIWQNEVKFADEPDYEFVIYGIDRGNLYTDNGQLHIKPSLAEDRFGVGFITLPKGLDLGVNCTGIIDSSECKITPVAYVIIPPTLSGRINTRPSFSFLYGRVDVRAKLPKGDWIYPELFLTPKKYEYGNKQYESGEIRIAFLPGNTNFDKELEGGIILGGDSDEARQFGLRKLKSESSWCDDFHIFSVIWKPVGITLLVDGKIYGNIGAPPGGFAATASKFNPDAALKWQHGDAMAPFDKEMIVTVGVGVGGHSFPDSFPNKPYVNTNGKGQYKLYRSKDTWFPTWNDESELVVDYIKIYAI